MKVDNKNVQSDPRVTYRIEDDMFKRSLVMACVSKTYGPNK